MDGSIKSKLVNMASTVWRGFVTFGLISIPVRLFRAARAERVSFRRVSSVAPTSSRAGKSLDTPEAEEQDDVPEQTTEKQPRASSPFKLERPQAATAAEKPVFAPVQQVTVHKGTGEALPAQSIVKGFEYEKGRFVAIDPEELKNLAPKTATEMQIEEFVRLDGIDPVYFETSYYLVPEEAGEKAYALLYKSLQKSGLVALAQFAMHNREHVVVIRSGKSGLIAHTMFYSSEVRGAEEFRADVTSINAKELQLAETLIATLGASFEPEKYRDTYREKLEEMIAKKVAGQTVTSAEKPSRSAAVIDITEALQKSLAALKKPAASEKTTPKEQTGRTSASPKKTSRGSA